MLKRLELAGFKSFAKKTTLDFKSRITAIVGPNGSGKSNTAEAFRFCLGEQSMKSMRGKRGEDLIWSGSTEITRAPRASVKVVFDNLSAGEAGGKVFDVDFDEVSIEREVGRDGVNTYSVNGSPVRLKDVVEMLGRAHIGASGHHIISQGEADRILNSNIKERKEMIEDALGLKVYQYKKEESQRKLEKTAQNIKEVESLRREIAPHLRFLKKQVEKVEKAEELRVRLSGFYREYLKREQVYIEEQNKEIEVNKKPVSERLHELEREMLEAREVLSNSSKKDEKSEKLIEIEGRIEKVRGGRDLVGREAGKIEGEESANQRSIEKIKIEQSREEQKTVLLQEVEDLEREVSKISQISDILEKLRSFIAKHKEKRDQKNLDELTKLGEELRNKRVEIENKIKSLDNELANLNTEYQTIKNSIEKEKDSSREAEKNIFKISSEQSELRARLNIIESEEKRMRLLEEDWKREIQEGGVLLSTVILEFKDLKIENLNENREEQENRRRELEKMKIRLEELGGGAESMEVMKEYKETTERDAFLERELEDLKKSAEALEVLIRELSEKLDVEFKDGVDKINRAFKEFFSLMFGGGNAELKIENSKLKIQDPDEIGQERPEVGLDIIVSLPRKRIKGLEMLSGGERALTSIALIFAMSQVNPPPFIILDETDAALDEANSKKYGDMIESLSKYSQLILITHNRETMSRAGIIYGVTMGRDGQSRLLSIAFDEAVAVAK